MFYTINPLLYEKLLLCISEPLFRKGEGIEATYAVHLRLIGKHVVDFVLVIIELLSLGAMVQALRANIDWKSLFLKRVDHFGPKFHVEGDVCHQLFVHR